MTEEKLEGMQGELDGWRARLDEVRLKANLGKMELRDRLAELGQVLEPAQARARKTLGEFAQAGSEEARVLASALHSGWEELVRSYHEAAAEAERKKDEAHAKKRHGN